MKSRMLNSIIVAAIVVVLAISSTLFAQVQKSAQACNQRLVEERVSADDINSPGPQGEAIATLRFLSFLGETDPVWDWLDGPHDGPGVLPTISTSGSQPTVSLSPGSLVFICFTCPIYYCPDPQQKTVTLTNLGPGVLDISGIRISGPFSQTNTCGSTLGAGRSCTITVTWGKKYGRGALSITDNGVGSPQTVPLQGGFICRF